MIPPRFDYARPASLDEALQLLASREGEAKVLAGGFSLLPLMKYRLAQPGLLVDIGRVAGLDAIEEVDGELRIGARATHGAIAGHPLVAARYPLIREAAGGIGDPQIRNWGTIGGSCAHADPASDWPAVIQALRGSFVCRSLGRERVVAARGFFLDVFTTGIEPTEVLTQVRVPRPGPRSGGAYVKLERRTGDFATVGVAAQVQLGADGRIAEVGLGLTAVADAPFAAGDAEDALRGALPTAEKFREAGLAAARQARPTEDRHGPVDYKLTMVRVMTERALRLATERAQANG
ncbi:MAG: carbon-monoxide dehydrogenase (acceptor), carbon-monoxide dehydrogenase medium subunit [Chloroflexi bacterium CSP1-4]|nr:MAG: carbon-monoxide dehydrogenase (acceptor), carbon-monoxide dehydrogenase medium subunit [Chloroflexi bacterium CSP1-4]